MKQKNYLNYSEETSMSKLINRWQYESEFNLDKEIVYHHINNYLNQFDLDKNQMLQLSSKDVIFRVKKQNQLKMFLDLITFLSSMERTMLYSKLRHDVIADLNNEENILTCNYY